MKSVRSYFNGSYFLHLLRRFWILHVLWLALLLLAGPIALSTIIPQNFETVPQYLNSIRRAVLTSGQFVAYAGFAAGPMMAMAVLSYLYTPRVCYMTAALPVRREAVFITAVLAGLLPMLASDLLVFLVLLARYGRVLGVGAAYAGTWLATVALSNAAWFGIACFCGVLTGSILILPAVYAVLNMTAVVAEAAVRSLLGVLVYGYTYSGFSLNILSPLAYLTRLRVIGTPAGEIPGPDTLYSYRIAGLGYLGALCAAGLVLTAAAVLILRRRQMETAGEIVAVPVLRPAFRVCMSVGTALVGTAVLCDGILSNLICGRPMAVAAAVLLCVFAAAGFFLAQMLMAKSLRVFRKGWKQLGVICACLVLLTVLAETDVIGYETYVPDPDSVVSVSLPSEGGLVLTEPESISAYCGLHRTLLANRAVDEPSGMHWWRLVSLEYTLQNGRTVSRLYRIAEPKAAQDPSSSATELQKVCDLPEAVLKRAGAGKRITADTVRFADVNVSRPSDDPMRGWMDESFSLTPEQAESLYLEGILPDAREGNIARWFLWNDPESEREQTNTMIQFFLEEEVRTPGGADYEWYAPSDVLYLNVLESSAHTRAWLKEHLDIVPENQHDLEGMNAYSKPYASVYG